MVKVSSIIITLGVIIFVSGIIFHLQGQAMVGPSSSFMYSNPDWIEYGIQIAIFGGIFVVVGIGIKIIKRI